MKRLISISVFLLIFSTLALASVIEIEVKMETKGRISALLSSNSGGVLKILPEFYNTGSVAYKARARLDVLNSSDLIFTGWSKEETLMPGERKNFEIYWFSPEAFNNLTANIRVYYGREIFEYSMPLDIGNISTQEDVFQIKSFRAYDDYIKFQIRSDKGSEDVLVIPKDYTDGWVFEQSKIGKISQDRNTEVMIKYEPTVWMSQEISLEVVTADGKYRSVKQFQLEKETGLLKYVHYLEDRIRLLLNL